jgi:hypothetical protein
VSGAHLRPATNFSLSLKFSLDSCEWTSLSFSIKLLLGLARTVTLGSKSLRTHGHILLSHLRPPLPNLEGQAPVFISPRNKVAQLYPRVLGSLFGTSYDSQGYGGGILTRLHTDFPTVPRVPGSRSHITTDGQSASSSWCLEPFGAGDQMLQII